MTVHFTVGDACELGVSVQAVSAFYKAHWTRRIALGLASFYRWQFLAPPASGGNDRCCVAVDDKGELLGVMGANPRPFKFAGHSRNGAEMSTWVVAERARGGRVGQAIMRHLQSRYDVLLGAGISAMAVPLYMKAGFRFIRALPRYVRLYRDLPDAFVRLTDAGRRMVQAPRAEIGVRYDSRAAAPGDAAAAIEDALRPLNHFVRDRDHLVWRYANHPVFAYETYAVSTERGRSVVVLREDEVIDTRFIHVVECAGDGEGVLGALAFIDDLCRERNAAFADFTGTASAIAAGFLQTGWLSALDDIDVQVANLFYPVEFRSPPTTSLMLWARHDMGALLDHGRLYFTKGDLDLDRPTVEYYEKRRLALE